MPSARLSRTVIDKLESVPGKQIRYFDTKLTGFGVKVNYNSKTYFVKCRVGSRQIYESIGRTDIVPYDQALDRARQILEDATNGIAPDDRRTQAVILASEQKAQAAMEKKKDITLQEMLTEYMITRKKLKQSSKDLYQEDVDRYLADWKDLPLRSIGADMIVKRHAEIGNAGARSRADGVMRVLRAVFNHGMNMYEDVIIRNPVKKLSAASAWYKLPARRTYIKPEELSAWLPAVLELGYDSSQDFILLLLFQGSRLTETGSLKWGDVDLVNRTAVFRETKTGVVLEVPLSKFIADRLTERWKYYDHSPDAYVFPSYGKTGHVVSAFAALRAVRDKCGIYASHHDLRRTFITYCQALKIELYTRKRLANHAIPQDVTEGYTFFDMTDLREAVESMADFILEKAGLAGKEKPPVNVIDLGVARIRRRM